jgi:hypothetical protein
MILKLKSLIYRAGGPYLADKEELEYITSEAACNRIEEALADPVNDMSLHDLQGLIIGLWQCEHKFYRRMKF